MATLLLSLVEVEASARATELNADHLRSRISELRWTRQLIVVTSEDWNAVEAHLQRFERGEGRSDWRPLGPAIEVVVGRCGMGWGIGLHGTYSENEPIKHEGDGRAPAGVFFLNTVFGYAKASEARIAAFPYREVTPSTRAVEDEDSKYYNRVVDAARIGDKDWKGSETMLRSDNLYQWGVVVEHNWHALPGAGSCIFMHIWRGPEQGTAGCTAMPRDEMEEIVRWLNWQKHPLLVQLPAKTYDTMKDQWGLPDAD
ncbi:MAG: L,D-transpeptidase family protein [Chthoniobacterales bacterium]